MEHARQKGSCLQDNSVSSGVTKHSKPLTEMSVIQPPSIIIPFIALSSCVQGAKGLSLCCVSRAIRWEVTCPTAGPAQVEKGSERSPLFILSVPVRRLIWIDQLVTGVSFAHLQTLRFSQAVCTGKSGEGQDNEGDYQTSYETPSRLPVLYEHHTTRIIGCAVRCHEIVSLPARPRSPLAAWPTLSHHGSRSSDLHLL